MRYYTFFLGLLLIYMVFDDVYSTYPLKGTYINTNYNYDSFRAEIPYGADTIYFNDDYTFNSHFHGEGKYELFNRLFFTEIHLIYGYNRLSARIQLKLKRSLFFKNKIILSELGNYHYREMD